MTQLPADWKCPDTLAEITRPLALRRVLRIVIVGAVVAWILAAVFSW